jgi:hypothetical protein
MLRAIALAILLSLTGFAQEPSPEVETKAKIASQQREAALSALVEKQEMRHFELHRFFIPVTQGNLQWLSAHVGAKSEEVLVVWKLMRQWDASRAERMRNPS